MMESLDNVPVNREEHYVPPEVRMYSAIGAYFKEQGLLNKEQVEKVLRSQQQTGLRFGEEAVRLGLLTQGQIDLILRRQFDVSTLALGESAISTEVVAAYNPDCPSISPLRSLRTILMSRHTKRGSRGHTLAITSMHPKDGRSLVAANLAVLFSQIGMRSIIVDADLRNPRQHQLFGIAAKHGLSIALARHSLQSMVEKVNGLGPLSLLPAGALPPSPEQLLNRPVFALLLGELQKEFDMVILDTPAGMHHIEALLVAEQASHTLVLARKDMTRCEDLSRFMSSLDAVKANVVGTILRIG
ncbi:chain length determinant protein tyrosine kinase EpsG [Massilia sp. TN1-12]|uniref:chain length determinant protein tyrosine kinase EpsG n=1 Tax=Massilia paldalensis TaxID=3377675 RepID=UPI00384CF032